MICCQGSFFFWWGRKKLLESTVLAPLCTVCVPRGCLWHTGHCQRSERFLWWRPPSSSVEQHDGKSDKEKKEGMKRRMCPHECDIVRTDLCACHDNRAEGERGPGGGDPWLFGEVQCAVLTSVTSLLSTGQMLEYQWTDWVALKVLLRTVRHFRGARCPAWPPLTCFESLAAFRPEWLIQRG